MDLIVGVVGPAAEFLAPSFKRNIENHYGARALRSGLVRTPTAILFSIRTDNISRSCMAGCGHAQDDGMVFVADARLDNRGDLGGQLSISQPELSEVPDWVLLYRAFRQSGARGIAPALGAFAFAAWDETAQRLVLGRDYFGARTLFYHRGDGFVAFASILNTLLSFPFVPRALDEDTIANYLALNLGRPSQTFYGGIARVPSRTLVTIDTTGLHHRHYWSPQLDGPPPFRRERDYIERARELFDAAVARATEGVPRIAVSMSGGLDSSAVAATAARLGKAASIKCYSVVPPAGMVLDNLRPGKYLSERDKVEALGRLYPELDIEFCEEGELLPIERDAVRYFAAAGTPVLNPWIMGALLTVHERARAAGYPILMNGRPGDAGLSWRGPGSLIGLLLNGKYSAFIRELRAIAPRHRRGIWGALGREVVLPFAWHGARQLVYRAYDDTDLWTYSGLNPAYVRDRGLESLWRSEGFHPLLKHLDWNPARFRSRYLFDYNQFARDTFAASRSIHGFEIREPHADRPLLEFLLRVPEPLYRQNGVPRSFARKVLADRLPPEILNETRNGIQGATWFRRMDIRRAEISDEVERLAASPLASRLLDVPRLKRTLDDWPKDAEAAELRVKEVCLALGRGLHIGRFVRWVEGGNA